MGLASALSTSLTGLTAAETTIDVVGNNLANSNTVGFKASEATFATQFLQTQSLGSAPTTGSGGTNPRQVGLGTMVAGITPDFTQGTIDISSQPTDLAIQGDGFFIVQGSQGEQYYTRNGMFKLNSQDELVTSSGNRLLGYGIDDNFEIQTTSLVPLEIPLGSSAVAQATQNVYLEGTLSPTGALADTASILQTAALGDASWESIDATGSATALSGVQPTTTAAGQVGAGALTAGGTYSYRIVFVDSATAGSTESSPSSAINIGPLGAGQNEVVLSNIPTSAAGTTRRVYRTTDGGATYKLVTTLNNSDTTYTDGTADAALGANLNTATITGNYTYYAVFSTSTGGPGFGTESRPVKIGNSLIVNGGRIQLQNIPYDHTLPSNYVAVRIYRNLSSNDAEFHYCAEIPTVSVSGLTWTDNNADSAIEANAEIDFDGPRATTSTRLVDLLRRDGTSSYEQIFQEGTLEFAGRKGGRTLTAKTLTIGTNTTVLDYLNFVNQAMGIQTAPGPDPLHPIQSTQPTGENPGGVITTNGQIRLVGNNGADNAIDIGLSSMQMISASGTQSVNMPFSTVQSAKGESAVADFIAYDSLGIPLSCRLTMALESRSSTATVYRWYANSGDNDPSTGVDISVGTGLISFDGQGNFLSATDSTVSIDRRHVSSRSPLEFELDFSKLSGLAASKSTLAVSRQDGSAPGVLNSFIIGEDGVIRGVFSNGATRDLGQIRLVRFSNPTGLEQKGQNLYIAGVNSGLPVEGNPGTQGIGSIIAGAVELSNTDIGANLIDLITASTMYRGNTRVITTVQQMLDELLALRR